MAVYIDLSICIVYCDGLYMQIYLFTLSGVWLGAVRWYFRFEGSSFETRRRRRFVFVGRVTNRTEYVFGELLEFGYAIRVETGQDAGRVSF